MRGLKGCLKRCSYGSVFRRIKNIWWELRYAWQRAWRGYDNMDVFVLGEEIESRIIKLLKMFIKQNNALWFDKEAGVSLTEEETNAKIQDIIDKFSGLDEDVVGNELFGEVWMDHSNAKMIDAVFEEIGHRRKEAYATLAKHIRELWY